MMLDGSGMRALGKVDEAKQRSCAAADVLCAPALGGESFGMVLTEAFAAGTPVLASDIPGYRDVCATASTGFCAPPVTRSRWPRRCAGSPSSRDAGADGGRSARARGALRVAAVAAEVVDPTSGHASPPRQQPRKRRRALRPGARGPSAEDPRRTPAEPPGEARQARPGGPPGGPADAAAAGPGGEHPCRRGARRAGAPARGRDPCGRLARGLQTRLVAAALAVMCVAMFARAIAWHAILGAAPTWRRASRRDAMQGTFIGVLMSATLPARMGESSRALIVARRIGRARETLPVVLGTMVVPRRS